MAEWPPLRERLPQLLERLPDDLGCQLGLDGSWQHEEECLSGVLLQAITE